MNHTLRCSIRLTFAVLCLSFTMIVLKVNATDKAEQKQNTKSRFQEFRQELKAGEASYNDSKLDDTLKHYHKAASLAQSGSDYIFLVWGLEKVLQKWPSYPVCHFELANAFYKSRNPELTAWESEMHCRRAIELSPKHRYANAERLLFIILENHRTVRNPSFLNSTAEKKAEFKGYVLQHWSAPKVCGLVLTRIRVTVKNNGQIKMSEITCTSGSSEFDQSALQSIKTAPFSLLRGSEIPGLLDFLFVSDANKKDLNYLSYGSVVVDE